MDKPKEAHSGCEPDVIAALVRLSLTGMPSFEILLNDDLMTWTLSTANPLKATTRNTAATGCCWRCASPFPNGRAGGAAVPPRAAAR